MYEYMQPLQPKDPNRLFSEIERELIYFKQNKRCAKCGGLVDWSDAEVHHVKQHSEGGPTSLDNGALVHKECHPKGEAAVRQFADVWNKEIGAQHV